MKGKSKLQVQKEAMTAEGAAHCTKDYNKSEIQTCLMSSGPPLKSSMYTPVPHLVTLKSSSKYLGKPWKSSLLSAYFIKEIKKDSPIWHFLQPQANFVPQKLKTS